MTIQKADVFHIQLPMKFVFTTGFGDIKSRDTLIIKLTSSDGAVGYGEAAALVAPVYIPETIETCKHILHEFLLPQLLHTDCTIEEYVQKTQFIRGNNLAKHGVESALWEIRSLQEHTPIWKLIGGVRTEIPVGESIGVQPTIESLVKVIEKRVSQGYQRIKIKIKPGWDVEPVRAIRERFPTLPVMVDANSSYRLDDFSLLKKLDSYNLMMIEQPLDFDDIIDHAKVQRELSTPICLDESILSASDARKAIEIGACRIINVKPGRVGGLIECMKINEIAKKHDVPLWCGGMLETGVGKAYNLAAASLSSFTLPADIVPTSTFYEEDITEPDIVVKKDGTVSISSQLGNGYTVSEKIISKYLVDSFTL